MAGEISGPAYLERRGWRWVSGGDFLHPNGGWWRDGFDRYYDEAQAVAKQHKIDAAALDRVLALVRDADRLGSGFIDGRGGDVPSAVCDLAAEIERLAGGEGDPRGA